ncbi:MAG: PD40 domain-containing protein [Bacteroidetes bacterium]|nr:PD40 domain-containing protein [Bacteroidota bacterium]
MVYHSDGNILAINDDGTWNIVLHEETYNVFEPVWSPNGTKIAYQSWKAGTAELYVMDVDGGNRTRLTDNSAYDDLPAWSPDGKTLLITELKLDDEGGRELLFYDVETGSVTPFLSSNFDEEDGLQSNLFRQGVYLKGTDGKVYFGGKDGLNFFAPEDVQINNYNSPVVISSFNVINEYGGKENILLNREVIELNPYENNLEIKIVSFDYSMPEKTSFKYKLSGDHDWTYLRTTNTIKIQNLSPGDYTLLVKGTNGDGVWSSNEAAVSFIIHPPFWQTLWFYLIILLVLVSVSIITHKLIVRSKVNRAVEIQKIKEKEGERIRRKTAIDFHDELGHRLTRISLLTELIKRTLGNSFSDISKLLNQIGDNSSQLYDGTKDFIWAIDPQQDSLYDLLIRLKDFGDELYSNAKVDFEVKGLDEQLQSASLSIEWKRHLMLIFKEGMNNSLKHSNGNRVSFVTHIEGNDLEISLEDNGTGFPQNIERKGNGINNMRRRAEKLDSSLLIDTQPGKGTKIIFKGKFPIKSLIYN